MTATAFVLAALPILLGGAPAPPVRLELRSSTQKLVAAEPYDLRLTLVNDGKLPIAVARHFVSMKIVLAQDGGEVACVSELHGTPGAPKVKWEEIAPGAELAVDLPAFTCLCIGSQSAACEDWSYRPGQYRFAVILSHVPGDVGLASAPPTPKEALDGSLRSNILDVRVQEPAGIDAEALEWAKKNGESPLSVAVANKYPGSTYAAALIYRKMDLMGASPLQVKKLIDSQNFPDWNSVPDPGSPDGWASRSGPELVRWQVEQGERILREHPDFSRVGPLRLAIGVGKLRLGEKQRGVALLTDLAANPKTPEGAWARAFLSLGP